MSTITKDAVEKALPTLKNIPIIGEFNEKNEDYKGHGGAIDLDSYKYIHTTKPYGVVPESATYEWEEVKGKDGTTREYLAINGCYLWTGRYEEAYSIIEKGKGQSMEIEVSEGKWVEEEESYQIDNFIFSALCILGDDVEPAFEDANITAYSLDRDSFKQEFSALLNELKDSLSEKKEDEKMLKDLLEKYSLTVEDLTAKGIKFNEISEDELEAKIIEVFELDTQDTQDTQDNDDNKDTSTQSKDNGDTKDTKDNKDTDTQSVDFEARVAELEDELKIANDDIKSLTGEVEKLREFKLNTEKEVHEEKAKEMFTNFQLTEEDVKDLDIHAFSIESIEEKCYAILGRKMAVKKNYTKTKDEGSIHLPLGSKDNQNTLKSEYGGLLFGDSE